MYKSEYRKIEYALIPQWKLVGKPEYADSIYEEGIRVPVLIATYHEKENNKLYLIGGNRRILSLQAAHKRAEEDGTLKKRPWLHFLPAIVYHDVPEHVRTAWMLSDNMERSENPLHAYLTIKAAMQAGNWEQVGELYRYNKAHIELIMSLDKLLPEFLDALTEGRMTVSVAYEVAKLGSRQSYLLNLVSHKTKNANKITMTDVKAAKQARIGAVMANLGTSIIPNTQMPVETQTKTMFLIANAEQINTLVVNGLVMDDFTKAFEEAQASGKTIYRLNQV